MKKKQHSAILYHSLEHKLLTETHSGKVGKD